MAKNFTNTKATGRMSNYNNMTMATDAAEEIAADAPGKKTKEQRQHTNIGFTLDNYNYISTMAKATGQTMTDLVNSIIDKSREENSEAYNSILALRNSL